MTRNLQGGKAFKGQSKQENFRSKRNREAVDDVLDEIKKCITKDAELQFARITRKSGGCMMEVYCEDGKTRSCMIRGILRRRKTTPMDIDSIVLIATSSLLRGDGEIMAVLSREQVQRLRKETPDMNPILFHMTRSGEAQAVDDDLFETTGSVTDAADDEVDLDKI